MQQREAQQHDDQDLRQEVAVEPGNTRPEEEAVPAGIGMYEQAYLIEPTLAEWPSEMDSVHSDSDEVQKRDPEPDKAHQANLPFPVPREMCLHIFSFLNTQPLQQTALVSKESYSLAAEIRKRQFLKKHSKSHWWKFLVALADDVPGEGENTFVEVLILGMGPNARIPERWRENNATLSVYLAHWMRRSQDKIQHLGFGVFGSEDIQKKAQSLLNLISHDNDRASYSTCTTLKDCFSLVEDKNKILAFQQYDDIDRLFSCLFLFDFMQQQNINQLDYLINSPFARGLTGEGLIALECRFPGLFPALVREAIRIFQIENKQEADNQRLKAVERLLGRLTEADILRYIDTEACEPRIREPLLVQRQTFIDVIRSNYKFLMAKLSINVLLRVERTIGYTEDFKSKFIIPSVIENYYMLSHLKAIELQSLLTLIWENEVGKVINDNTLLQRFCTVEIMEELLKAKTGCSKVASVFLSNKTLLDKLSDDHVVAFLAHVYTPDFEAILGNDAFRTRLRESPSNDLLVRVARAHKIYTTHLEPLKNLDVFCALTGDEAIELFDDKEIRFGPVLFSNKSLMDKLSSTQLLHFICKCDYRFRDSILKEHLHRLTTCDFVRLTQIALLNKDLLELKKSLLAFLPAEIDRRVSAEVDAEYHLESKALCQLSCVHQELACYILERHAEKLEASEFLSINDHYPLKSYDSNTPVSIVIAKECHRSLEKLEKTSKATDAQRSSTAVSPLPPSTSRRSSSEKLKKRESPRRKPPPPLVTDEEWSWVYFILKLICVVGVVFGLFLAISGIGSAAGISMMASVTTFLFASLPMSSALVTGILGFGIFIASSIGWLKTDEAETARFGAKNNSPQNKINQASHTPQFSKPPFNATNGFKNPSVGYTVSKQVDPTLADSKDEKFEDPQSRFCINHK